VTPGTAATGE